MKWGALSGASLFRPGCKRGHLALAHGLNGPDLSLATFRTTLGQTTPGNREASRGRRCYFAHCRYANWAVGTLTEPSQGAGSMMLRSIILIMTVCVFSWSARAQPIQG